MTIKTFLEIVNMYVELYNENDDCSKLLEFIIPSLPENSLKTTIKLARQELDNRARHTKHYKELFEEQLNQTLAYLKGEMYTDEDTAKQMLSKQIENIERVLE